MPADDHGVYVISVAAELAGVHPQTLRAYERKGLLAPTRTEGGTRRYSAADIDRLRRIGELTGAGVNLEGVRRVLELEEQLRRGQRTTGVGDKVPRGTARARRRPRRELVPVSQALVPWRRTSPPSKLPVPWQPPPW